MCNDFCLPGIVSEPELLGLPAHLLNAALQGSEECFSVRTAQLTVSADSVAALECAFTPLRAGAAACTLMLRCDSGQMLSHKVSGTGEPACMTEIICPVKQYT